MFLTHLRLASNRQFTVLKNVFPPALAQKHWIQLLNSVYREEGWKNSQHDYQSWRRSFPTDSYSIWYAIDEETQKVVGCSSMAAYEPFQLQQQKQTTKLLPLSMFGMFYVMRQYQGLGIGRRIFCATMDECKERNNIFLYGLKDSWERYERGDPAFNKKPEWKLLVMNAKPGDIDIQRLNVLLKKMPTSLEVIDWKNVPWNQLAQYDAKLSIGYDREEYLRQSFEQPDSHTMVVISKNNQNKNSVHGLGRIRRCIDDHFVIGPLYADEPLIAKMLLRALLQPNLFPAPPKSIHYRAPDSNLEAVHMFQEMAEGKVELEILHPQFTKEVVKFPTKFIYCVSEADNAIY